MRRVVATACLVRLAALAADLEIRGGLEQVNNDYIAIRQADGDRIYANLAKTGPLSSEKISAQLHLADEVSNYLQTEGPGPLRELKSIHFLRAPLRRNGF